MFRIDNVFLQSAAAVAAAKLLQSCPTLCDPIDPIDPIKNPIPGILQARTLGVCCHFFLQCMRPATFMQNS